MDFYLIEVNKKGDFGKLTFVMSFSRLQIPEKAVNNY